MILGVPTIGQVPASQSVSRDVAVRSTPRGGGASGEFAEVVDALTGAVPSHARNQDTDWFFDDFSSGRGRTDQPRDGTGTLDDEGGAGRPEPITPFRIEQAAGNNGTANALMGLPLRSQITHAVDVYDQAIQAVTFSRPADLLGQQLNRVL